RRRDTGEPHRAPLALQQTEYSCDGRQTRSAGVRRNQRQERSRGGCLRLGAAAAWKRSSSRRLRRGHGRRLRVRFGKEFPARDSPPRYLADTSRSTPPCCLRREKLSPHWLFSEASVR